MVHQQSLDRTFFALADSARRAVVAQLAHGEATISELAERHEMSLPGFLKHVRTLERAGLVTTRKSGRVRTCRLRAAALADAEEWLHSHRLFWQQQLESLARLFAEGTGKEA